jgi:Putative metal-binding motif
MSTRLLNLRRGLTLVTFAVFAVSSNTAFATSSVARSIDQFCASQGNPLIVPGPLVNNCTSCHNDGRGGSGAGKTAARGNNATKLAFFCPAVVTPPPVATCTDMDGDGYSIEGGACGAIDCNDRNPDVNPGAQEDCRDGIDNNCNGRIDTVDPAAINCPVQCADLDGDGYSPDGGTCGEIDCDDNNAALNPGAEEICTDGVDNNCNDMVDAADAACTVVDDPMQALLDQIALLQSQLAQCQAGEPPVVEPPVVEPPVVEPPADDDDDAEEQQDRRSRWSWRTTRSRDD